jgi:hypothetical protein
MASRDRQRIVPGAKMDWATEELLELCDVAAACVTELDLEGAQAGVGEAPDASNEIRGSELHGLSRH